MTSHLKRLLQMKMDYFLFPSPGKPSTLSKAAQPWAAVVECMHSGMCSKDSACLLQQPLCLLCKWVRNRQTRGEGRGRKRSWDLTPHHSIISSNSISSPTLQIILQPVRICGGAGQSLDTPALSQ